MASVCNISWLYCIAFPFKSLAKPKLQTMKVKLVVILLACTENTWRRRNLLRAWTLTKKKVIWSDVSCPFQAENSWTNVILFLSLQRYNLDPFFGKTSSSVVIVLHEFCRQIIILQSAPVLYVNEAKWGSSLLPMAFLKHLPTSSSPFLHSNGLWKMKAWYHVLE